MSTDNDIYEVDAHGNRVLIGLSHDETEEFFRLDATLAEIESQPSVLTSEWHSPGERRWLELYEKHRAALKPFLCGGKTRH
jgi:hypothetical protein